MYGDSPGNAEPAEDAAVPPRQQEKDPSLASDERSLAQLISPSELVRRSLSRSESALGAFYRRLCSHMDKPRANTATAHKLARMVYFILTRGEDFVAQGPQRYEEQQRQRSIAALKRRAAALGVDINPMPAPA